VRNVRSALRDSIAAVDGSTVSSKVVRGKPVARWRQFRDSPGVTIWMYASAPALILAAVKLLFFYSRLSTWGTIFYVLLALVAIGGLITLSVYRENLQIECECPSCGTSAWFSFQERSEVAEPRVAMCDHCLIYMSIKGDEVAEVPLETVLSMPNFEIHSDQYAPHAPRNESRYEFVMPAFCALCGSTDAPHQRGIQLWELNTGVNTGVLKQVEHVRTGSVVHGFVQNSPSDAISAVLHVQVPVCEKHKALVVRPEPLAADNSATLCCASYRFYKAFVVANNVVPRFSEGLPSARVRSAG